MEMGLMPVSHLYCLPSWRAKRSSYMTKTKILIIEDDIDIQSIITHILTDEGYEVMATSHCHNEHLTLYNADLILLDERVNKKEGHMLCKELKDIHTTQHIPVIILSTAGNIEEIARSCNADGFVPKPFDIDELVLEVKRVLVVEQSSAVAECL
jgi:DNA-binding response OmpR family regulator